MQFGMHAEVRGSLMPLDFVFGHVEIFEKPNEPIPKRSVQISNRVIAHTPQRIACYGYVCLRLPDQLYEKTDTP
jgi:hypothetical protein